MLSRGLNQTKRWGYVAKNAVEGVELPSVKRQRIQPADEEQALALLDVVKGHRLEALYWITLFLGLRRREVVELLKENIDWQTNTITIDGSLQRVKGLLPKAIQEILGHANITTTLNIYGHLLPKVLRSATDRMGTLAPDEETDETQ